MVYRGHVENGMIRLEDRAAARRGRGRGAFAHGNCAREKPKRIPSVCEGLKDFVGKAEGLPPDASMNLDHYLYGVPKRQ